MQFATFRDNGFHRLTVSHQLNFCCFFHHLSIGMNRLLIYPFIGGRQASKRLHRNGPTCRRLNSSQPRAPSPPCPLHEVPCPCLKGIRILGRFTDLETEILGQSWYYAKLSFAWSFISPPQPHGPSEAPCFQNQSTNTS